ncbi:MAG: type II secretion system protein J [Phycisphaerae bacterium]
MKNRKPESDRTTPRGRRGFTLAEVLIALGIMAIGLTLVSALFPAAIRQQANTINDTLGMQICHNGLAIVKARCSHALLNGKYATLTDITNGLNPSDVQYPIGSAAAGQEMRGFKLLARQYAGDINDYQFVLISYGKADAADTVTVAPVSGLVFTGSTGRTVQAPAGVKLPIGTPIIDPATGLYATVQGVAPPPATNPPTYLLDHPFSNGAGGFITVNSAYIVTETDSSGQLPRSPVMSVLVNRTALRNN